MPGAVQYDHAQPVGSRRQSLRGNLVGTTERMVGESGVVTQRSVYTAFGELAYQAGVGQTRYGYAGAWGYEAASGVSGYVDPLAELGWLHVGERYYDPASGRFTQRDPIGIAGGLNVYLYVLGIPTIGFDPFGMDTWVNGGPWYARWFLNVTGGTRSWLDDPTTVRNVSIGLGAGGTLVGGGAICAGFALAGAGAGSGAIGGAITGYTAHGLNQAISRDGVGVAARAILDAVRNPQQIVQQAEGAVKYIGSQAVVVLNGAGQVITTWAQGGSNTRIGG